MKNLPRYGLGILAVLGIIGTAACGDDDDDRLTDEEYFTQLDKDVYQEFDRALEEEVFGGETAGEVIDDFLAAVDTVEEGIRDLEPPEDLEENHDRLLEGVDAATDFLEQAAEGVEDDTPIEELETILVAEPGSESPFIEVQTAECELVAIAEERGFDLEYLTCDLEAGGETESGEETEETGGE